MLLLGEDKIMPDYGTITLTSMPCACLYMYLYTLPLKGLGSVRFLMFLKNIYLIKNTEKNIIIILWNIIAI